jgi:hypothetical protein
MSSQDKIISAFKGLYVALSSLAAYLSSTLIKERLIPEQLEVIGTVGTFFILVALLLTIIYWNNLSRALTLFILVTIVALCLLTFMQIQYVVTANVGPPNKAGIAENNFLIGFKLTEYGQWPDPSCKWRDAWGKQARKAIHRGTRIRPDSAVVWQQL